MKGIKTIIIIYIVIVTLGLFITQFDYVKGDYCAECKRARARKTRQKIKEFIYWILRI